MVKKTRIWVVKWHITRLMFLHCKQRFQSCTSSIMFHLRANLVFVLEPPRKKPYFMLLMTGIISWTVVSQWPQSFLTFLKPLTGSHTVNSSLLLPTRIRPTSGLVLQLSLKQLSLKQISESGPGWPLIHNPCCNLKSSPVIYIRPSSLILYADDLVLYMPIASHSDVEWCW